MFLAKGAKKRRDGTYYSFWTLRETVWDKTQRRPIQRYVAYIGTKPVLTEKKARELAKKIGCTLDDLKRVRRLKIVE